jgi:hypothetical protein
MKIYRAEYDSRNFEFVGYGTTESQAKKTLMLALKRHTKQFDLAKDWYYKDDILVLEYEIGTPYRDRSEIKEPT